MGNAGLISSTVVPPCASDASVPCSGLVQDSGTSLWLKHVLQRFRTTSSVLALCRLGFHVGFEI